MMKNKKGFLLAEETLKTVLAVIAICFLIYFLVSLYFGNLEKTNQKHADATLETIDEYIKAGGEALGITPVGWYVFGFTEEAPNPCAGKNCLCICDDVHEYFWTEGRPKQIKECGENGRCLVIENLEAFEDIEIKKEITSIRIKKEDNKIIIEEIK